MIKKVIFVALLMMAAVSLLAQEVNKEDYITGYGRANGAISMEKLQDLAFADACYRLYNLLDEQSEHLIDVYVERYGCSELVKNMMKKHWTKMWLRAFADVEMVYKREFSQQKDGVVLNSVEIEVGINKSKLCDMLDSIGNSVTADEGYELNKEQGALEQFTAGNKKLVEYWQKMCNKE